jgi:hypothetical protein
LLALQCLHKAGQALPPVASSRHRGIQGWGRPVSSALALWLPIASPPAARQRSMAFLTSMLNMSQTSTTLTTGTMPAPNASRARLGRCRMREVSGGKARQTARN